MQFILNPSKLHPSFIRIIMLLSTPEASCLHSDELIYETSKLISLLHNDSEYAFQLLYDRHRRRIYCIALRYLKSPVLAQEVVQDVFLKLWFSRHGLNDSEPIEAWLHTVARNNIFNRLKRLATEWQAARELRYATEMSVTEVEEKLDDQQYGALLQEAIGQLPDQQQKVFRLAREQQLTYAQIGELLSLSPLTVKTHMARALTGIKKHLLAKGINLSSFLILLF